MNITSCIVGLIVVITNIINIDKLAAYVCWALFERTSGNLLGNKAIVSFGFRQEWYCCKALDMTFMKRKGSTLQNPTPPKIP